MADSDVPAEKSGGSSGGGWGGWFAVVVVVGAFIRFFGGGKADKPVPPPRNDTLPQAVGFARQDDPPADPVGRADPWAGAPDGHRAAPPARRRCPQEALGWGRSQCMFCKKQRSRHETGQFSDSDGFGFCTSCGTCANAFAVHRSNLSQGFGSDQRTEELAKVYTESVGNRYPLQMAAFVQWGDDRAWRETWHNFAVLTVPGYTEDR